MSDQTKKTKQLILYAFLFLRRNDTHTDVKHQLKSKLNKPNVLSLRAQQFQGKGGDTSAISVPMYQTLHFNALLIQQLVHSRLPNTARLFFIRTNRATSGK